MKNHKIAILLSTYNGASFLEEQIESIINQDYKNWELFIRDDGSTDLTKKIIYTYCEKFDNFHFIEDGHNRGAALSFLYLLNHVKADYYMFCDQDDVWLDNKISSSYSKLREHEEKSKKPILIFSDAKVVDQNLNVIDESFWNYNKTPPKILLRNHNYIKVFNSAPGCTMIFNKELKKYISENDNILMHDWYILIKAFENGIVDYISESLMLYRQHTNNVVGADKISTKRYIKKILNIRDSLKLQIMVYRFVKKYTNVNILEFYILKIKFNFFRFKNYL